uniref:G-protein coupled receptors family 1 profile domain-containing protein n=1 Tax=Oryzias melastigma TaxID=30732 RepID=A0A3B3DT42_ORYME
MASLSFPISSLEKNVSSSVTLDPSSSPVSFPTLSSTLLPSSNCTSAASPSSPPYNFYAVLLVLLIFCVVFGNVLVCIAVSRERALQTTTNYLIVSLAVSDLLLATLVMPWGVYLEVYAVCGHKATESCIHFCQCLPHCSFKYF